MEEVDEFEAMEAEAEALAQKANEGRRTTNQTRAPQQVRPMVRPGQPNPNITAKQPIPPQQQQRPTPKAQPQQQQEAQALWVAFYQPEVTGIVNTQTGERIEGFKDEGNAQAMARILNDLNTVIISGGY